MKFDSKTWFYSTLGFAVALIMDLFSGKLGAILWGIGLLLVARRILHDPRVPVDQPPPPAQRHSGYSGTCGQGASMKLGTGILLSGALVCFTALVLTGHGPAMLSRAAVTLPWLGRAIVWAAVVAVCIAWFIVATPLWTLFVKRRHKHE